jgi:hypothetical protein
MDCKKSTKKFVSTTMSKEAPQLIFLSGVHLELLVSRFIWVVPNDKAQAHRALGVGIVFGVIPMAPAAPLFSGHEPLASDYVAPEECPARIRHPFLPTPPERKKDAALIRLSSVFLSLRRRGPDPYPSTCQCKA